MWGVLMVAGLCVGGAAWADYPGPHEAGPNVYKQLFENDRVRISEIDFDPGEAIPMHHHAYGHSVYILEAGQLTITKPDGSSSVVDAKAGDVMWMGIEDHAARNTGPTRLRGLVTEIKS
jgi:quercetin dioxygenase-like cupin family protein